MDANQGSPRRTLVGQVVSDKSEKTISVLVKRRKLHKKLGKLVTVTKKICAHNPENVAKTGDLVVVGECRKISKRKSWTLVEIQQKAVEKVAGV